MDARTRLPLYPMVTEGGVEDHQQLVEGFVSDFEMSVRPPEVVGRVSGVSADDGVDKRSLLGDESVHRYPGKVWGELW